MNVVIPIVVELSDEQAHELAERLPQPVWFDRSASPLVLALLRSASPALQE